MAQANGSVASALQYLDRNFDDAARGALWDRTAKYQSTQLLLADFLKGGLLNAGWVSEILHGTWSYSISSAAESFPYIAAMAPTAKATPA